MTSLLLDTNVLSELRKGARGDANVRAWFAGVESRSLWLSVLVLGEVRRGIERIRARDEPAATALDRWIVKVEHEHASRILPVDRAIAEEWGRIDAKGGLSPVDGLMAATARVHGMVFVTRNVKDVARTGVQLLNPFAPVS